MSTAQSASNLPLDITTARNEQQNHRFESSEQVCRAILEREPDNCEVKVVLGISLIMLDKGTEGMELLESVLGPVAETVPDEPPAEPPDCLKKHESTAHWYSDVGLAYMMRGEVLVARAVLERALEFPDPPAAAYTRAGALFLGAGDMELAEHAFTEAANREPKRAEHHANLGSIKTRLGRYQEALGHYNRSVFLNPDLPQAQAGRSNLLVALERSHEAIFELEARIDARCEEEPDGMDCVTSRIRLAHVLEATGRWDDAIGVLREGYKSAKESTLLLMALGNLYAQRMRFGLALVSARLGLELDEKHLGFLLLASRATGEMGEQKKALEYAAKALEIAPEAPACILARTQALAESDRTEEAETELRSLLETLPGLFEGWSQLGQLLLQAGRTDEATEAMERAAEISPSGLAALVDAKKFPDDKNALESLRRIADNPLAHRDVRASMNFALARLHEHRAEYEEAFDRADKANEQTRMSSDFDMDEFEQTAHRIMELFTPGLFEHYRGTGSPSPRPIFVVGMPRSGTTLTEQILASHPQVFGAGELGYIPAITRLMPKVIETHLQYPNCLPLFEKHLVLHAATYYLRKIAALDDQATRVVDKLPFNFLHVGLIKMIFPKASIISVRRNPLDVAVSNYFVNFKHRHGLGFSNDMGDMARMLDLHRRMMDHWHTVLPGPMFELEYEELVASPETNSRALLDFVGLEWDETVLDFHKTRRPVKTASVWQVRKPMYSSSKGRWTRYEQRLQGLRADLERLEREGPVSG